MDTYVGLDVVKAGATEGVVEERDQNKLKR